MKTYSIIDINGRIILNKDVQSQYDLSVETGALESGIYFINIVIEVKTNFDPPKLASTILLVEKYLQRKRDKKNDPRTCDIDIIDFNGLVEIHSLNKEKFEIPHKELSKRNFVLFPLYEIEPKWKHPKTKETVKELINKLSSDKKKSILIIKKN